MVWPFNKKSKTIPVFEFSGDAFFEAQCKFGDTRIEIGKGIVALVLDAAKKYGVSVAVKVEADGRQLATLKVASDQGGFVVPAMTPSGSGDRLKPGDVVMWVPLAYNKELAEKAGDKDFGWVGLIRAKVAREMNFNSGAPTFKILCRYD
jgi:hypothetical protein